MSKRFLALVAVTAWTGAALAADPPERTKFQTAKVKRGDLPLFIHASGTLEPEEVIDIGAQVSGVVEKVEVEIGATVEKGAVLARLDATLYKLRVEVARAGLDRTKAELKLAEVQRQVAADRLDRLRKAGNVVAPEDLQAAQAQVETTTVQVLVRQAELKAAEAALKEAETNLDYTVIRSPIKGVVLDRRVNPGARVTADLSAPSLFLVAPDLAKLELWLSVPEGDIGQIKKGQPVSFTVPAHPDRVFGGKVEKIRLNATMTQNVVTYTVVVQTDNTNRFLLPYMTGLARIADGSKRENVFLVPNEALKWRPLPEQVVPEAREAYKDWRYHSRDRELKQSGLVWVVEKSGLVRPVAVRLGKSDWTVTEITAGELPEGTPVVVGLEGMPLFPER
jgi:HlyD family secretion protein